MKLRYQLVEHFGWFSLALRTRYVSEVRQVDLGLYYLADKEYESYSRVGTEN